MTVTTAVVVLPRRVAVWASRRAVARTSVTGIELACLLCAAVWFSAGTRLTALAGGAALGGGYLAHRVGRQLTTGAFDGWLASLCALAGELAVYAGLAAAAAQGQPRVWALATAAAILLGMREAARLCRPARPAAPPPGESRQGDERPGPGRTLALLAARLPGLPAGERAVVITVTAALYGTRMSLLVLIWWGAVALAWTIAGPRPGSGWSQAADGAASPPLRPGRYRGGPGRRPAGPLRRGGGARPAGAAAPCRGGPDRDRPARHAGLARPRRPGPAHPGRGHAPGRARLRASARRPAGLADAPRDPGRGVRLPGRARLRQGPARPARVRADRAGGPAPSGRRLPGPAPAAGRRCARRDRLGRPDAGGRGGCHAQRGPAHVTWP